ncbi:Zn-dependent exopeptidase [Dentipellis sp. KUC8613]|nr:Zn-dependent exopeptidase [Dentipellis sp. KUC8613]
MTIAKLANSLFWLTVYPFEHANDLITTHNTDPCLTANFYGTYGNQSIFLPPHSCYTSNDLPTPAESPLLHPLRSATQLVWVEELAVEAYLKPSTAPNFADIAHLLAQQVDPNFALAPDAQHALASPTRAARLLHSTAHSALLALDPAAAYRLADVLPGTWRAYALPAEPLAPEPVPDAARARVRALLKDLRFDPAVAGIVDSISLAQMRNDVRWLTGEAPESPIVSRHSFSEGSRVAAEWLKTHIEGTGARCELRTFISGFAPNVICRYAATENTTATVLISAHYDSRGTFGSTRAPGGDDDGSGTTGILAIARTIGRTGVTFRSNVELALFAGEEQGLYGSYAYARDSRQESKNLTIMVQADMTAYHAAGEPPQLGLPETIGTTEVTQLAANISGLYSPELVVGYTSACCSDHQSFHNRGFPATQVFERAGPIADPMYHNSGDLSERKGYDLKQAKAIAKVQFAMVLHAAGFDLPKGDEFDQ